MKFCCKNNNNDEKPSSEIITKIFGFDLFKIKNKRASFEPNLRMATPKNYQIGPDDEIIVDVNRSADNEDGESSAIMNLVMMMREVTQVRMYHV